MLNLLTPCIRTFRLLKLGQSPQYNFISTFPLFLSQKIFSHQFFMDVSLVHCYMCYGHSFVKCLFNYKIRLLVKWKFLFECLFGIERSLNVQFSFSPNLALMALIFKKVHRIKLLEWIQLTTSRSSCEGLPSIFPVVLFW